jgi:hypothetical protein
MRRNGFNRLGGHSDCHGYVLVSLSQQDRLLKASCYPVVYAAEPGLISIYRTDSIIATLMTYSINSGLVTR